MPTLLKSLGVACALAHASVFAAAGFALRDGTLSLNEQPVLRGLPATCTAVADPTGAGVFLRVGAAAAQASFAVPLGTVDGLGRFTSTTRSVSPWWMRPNAGTTAAEVKPETQWLLAETGRGDCVMLVPLFDDPLRFSLAGSPDGLVLNAQTDDDAVTARSGVALYVAAGRDPYAMAEAGARAVAAHLGTTKLRRDKPLPDFVDLFGWCTWDAFYQDVTAANVRTGLASFAAGGVEPRFMILDDGWQDVKTMPGGEKRLASLMPNQAQFGGDLAPTVRLAKEEFKIRTFLVWQAAIGYWGGVDGNVLSGYDVREVARRFGPGFSKREQGQVNGFVAPDRAAKFYNDYHAKMRVQGVDGVKVDGQAFIEVLAQGQGGRVAVYRAYRAALEDSVARNFGGRLINCMSNALETYYMSPRSTVIRTSDDYYPKRPESHGQHLYANSQVSVWFGEFMQPDWDMFQTAHPLGGFHAAARAVSGGPVYVSDKPEAHDFALLRQLVLSDGTVLRADRPGRPTRDCLFADVTRDAVLLKIFNYNRDCAVIGIFNATHHEAESDRAPVTGTVSPADAPEMVGDDFAAFAHQANRVWRCHRGDRAPVKLAEGGWEIVSYAPVDRGLAVLGLADKFNGTGAVTAKTWIAGGACAIALRDGGEFLAWSEKPPHAVEAAGQPVAFRHDPATGRLSATLPAAGAQTVVIRW